MEAAAEAAPEWETLKSGAVRHESGWYASQYLSGWYVVKAGEENLGPFKTFEDAAKALKKKV